MTDNKQIRELVTEIYAIADNDEPASNHGFGGIKKRAKKVLALLDEPCPNPRCEEGWIYDMDLSGYGPPRIRSRKRCPDCQSQEPAKPVSEFVERARDCLDVVAHKLNTHPSASTLHQIVDNISAYLREACDRLEAAERKEISSQKGIDELHDAVGKANVEYFELKHKLEAATKRADEAEAERIRKDLWWDKEYKLMVKQLNAKLEAATKRADEAEAENNLKLLKEYEAAELIRKATKKIKQLEAKLEAAEKKMPKCPDCGRMSKYLLQGRNRK